MSNRQDGKDGAGFWKNGRFYWDGQEHEVFEVERKSQERKERVNGKDPQVSQYCDCGAKHDRDFPNIHSPFCKAYTGNK